MTHHPHERTGFFHLRRGEDGPQLESAPDTPELAWIASRVWQRRGDEMATLIELVLPTARHQF